MALSVQGEGKAESAVLFAAMCRGGGAVVGGRALIPDRLNGHLHPVCMVTKSRRFLCINMNDSPSNVQR